MPESRAASAALRARRPMSSMHSEKHAPVPNPHTSVPASSTPGDCPSSTSSSPAAIQGRHRGDQPALMRHARRNGGDTKRGGNANELIPQRIIAGDHRIHAPFRQNGWQPRHKAVKQDRLHPHERRDPPRRGRAQHRRCGCAGRPVRRVLRHAQPALRQPEQKRHRRSTPHRASACRQPSVSAQRQAHARGDAGAARHAHRKRARRRANAVGKPCLQNARHQHVPTAMPAPSNSVPANSPAAPA